MAADNEKIARYAALLFGAPGMNLAVVAEVIDAVDSVFPGGGFDPHSDRDIEAVASQFSSKLRQNLIPPVMWSLIQFRVVPQRGDVVRIQGGDEATVHSARVEPWGGSRLDSTPVDVTLAAGGSYVVDLGDIAVVSRAGA